MESNASIRRSQVYNPEELGDYERFILNTDREEWTERLLDSADRERKERRENTDERSDNE